MLKIRRRASWQKPSLQAWMLACAGSLIWPTVAAAQEGDPEQPPAAPQTPATTQTPPPSQTPPASQTFVAEETVVEQPTYVAPPTYSAEEVQTSTEDGRDAGAFDGGNGRISLIAGTGSSVGDAMSGLLRLNPSSPHCF
jgi:hypothetical protein